MRKKVNGKFWLINSLLLVLIILSNCEKEQLKCNGLKKLDRNLITLKFLSYEKIETKI